ncbi:MAG: phage terminase large subunit [Porcipelethomonas sp.]
MNAAELMKIAEKKGCTDVRKTDPVLLSDYFELIRLIEKQDIQTAVSRAESVYETAAEMSRRLAGTDTKKAVSFYELAKKSALFLAPHRFHFYMIYVEWNREPRKKFYVPRMKALKKVVNDLQDLDDDKIDFLAVSLPPRVGKSTIGIFFVTWLMGKYPDMANLMSGHSDKLTEGFYREALSIISDSEYLWADVFPGCRIASTSAKNESIDLNKSKRFPTLTCRTVGGTLTGAVEAAKLLYVDDIIEDLEESLNPDRLQNKYDAYLNQLKDRKKDGCKELHIGTRWNVNDVIGRIQEQYKDNRRYRFRVIPALNENDESNFNYPFKLGFSTEYYHDMRNSIDNATWCAKYLGEPYVREGLLFPADELQYYNNSLPDGEPDRILAVCDVAWGGGDSLAMPFAWIYGKSVYIGDVIFNKGGKDVTRPIVIGRTKQHMPHQERFEANNGGDEYADKVDETLRAEGICINISHRKAPNTSSKLARIIQYAPDIKKFYFLDRRYQSQEYREFMKELTSFVQTGKNKHDDAPDSLAMLVKLIADSGCSVEIIKKPF